MQSSMSTQKARRLFLLSCSSFVAGCGGGGGDQQISSIVATHTGGPPDFGAPLEGTLSASVVGGGGYGYYSNGQRKVGGIDFPNHYGIDLTAPSPAKVVAARSGVVIRAAFHKGFGNLVIVQTDALVGRGIIYNLYAHLASIEARVSFNARVVQGQPLGQMGITGEWQDGPHLHFEFIESASALAFAKDGNSTGVAPNYTAWKDPAIQVPALRSWVGPGESGFTPVPSAANILRSGTSFRPPSTRSAFVEWSESTGATAYAVLVWYVPDIAYTADPEISKNFVPHGLPTEYSSILMSAEKRRYEWRMDGAKGGTYLIKVQAHNSSGIRYLNGIGVYGID